MTQSLQTNQLPTRFTCWHDEATVVSGNAIAATVDTGQYYGFVAQQGTPANGNSFSYSVFLRAGTYFFSVLGQVGVTGPKVDWTLNGASIAAAQDWYNGSTVKNTVKVSSSFTITADGYYKLVGTVNGRNASNTTGWDLKLTKYWFKQATD